MPIGTFGPTCCPGKFLPAPQLEPTRYLIIGVTKDANGAVLPFCKVQCFETVSGKQAAEDTSDADGNYQVVVNGQNGLTYFCVGYLAGSPDVAGTTLNTLLAIPE